MREVAEEYSRNDPEAAVEWAGALPEQHQSSALSESFERWTREDAVAAGEYLTGMSDGTARDAAVSSFSRELDRNDPQTAAQWAASIGDEGVRTETLESVARSWMRTNKDEAQAWLPSSGLAPEMQERIVADAEALATAETVYTEAMAAMGLVHPFFERAGMTAHRFWPSERDQRLLDVMGSVGLEKWRLARAAGVWDWMRGAGESGRLFEHELERWSGCGVEEGLVMARERLLREVVYYIHRNEVAGDG